MGCRLPLPSYSTRQCSLIKNSRGTWDRHAHGHCILIKGGVKTWQASHLGHRGEKFKGIFQSTFTSSCWPQYALCQASWNKATLWPQSLLITRHSPLLAGLGPQHSLPTAALVRSLLPSLCSRISATETSGPLLRAPFLGPTCHRFLQAASHTHHPRDTLENEESIQGPRCQPWVCQQSPAFSDK